MPTVFVEKDKIANPTWRSLAISTFLDSYKESQLIYNVPSTSLFTILSGLGFCCVVPHRLYAPPSLQS